jgi:transposase
MKQIVSVGIDVSKGKSTVCAMIHPNTIIKESFEVLHTVEEMSMLADYIGSLDGEIRIVMESTGHYHLPVAQFLYQKGFFVCVENAYIIRQFSRIMLHGAKTDPLDAKKLAKYGLAYWSELKPYKFHPSCYTELSLLSKQYQTYIKLLIAAKQNVIHLMDEMLPGFKEALDTASSVQFSKVKYVDFAKEFYHVDMIKSMGKEIFRENYKQWCKEKGYRFQSEKADELFHLAEDGIPTLPTEFPSTRLCMEVATEQVSQLGYALEQILSQMQNLAKTLPEYQTIRQMGGMGEKLCVRFIADIGDVRRFHNGKALVAYAGIDAPPYQSGQYTGTKRRISKRGNSALRKTGYEVMKSLKSHPPKTDTRVYDFIIKKENQGKSKKQAKIAGLNKFLQIYYARVMEIYKNIV